MIICLHLKQHDVKAELGKEVMIQKRLGKEVMFISHDGSKMSDYDRNKVIFVRVNIPIWPYYNLSIRWDSTDVVLQKEHLVLNGSCRGL